MKKILIIGATSAIAEATAILWAKEGNRIHLIARNEERLISMTADLKIRGAESITYSLLDVSDFNRHKLVIDKAIKTLEGIDIVLIAHGTVGDQKACEKDFELTLKELNTNAISVISLLTCLANRFEEQKHGVIGVITSVAGDRGRQSNYIYGTAKGALTIFLQGLRNRLYKSGVHVLTIKPGYVDTPMTAGLKKGILWAKPQSVALTITKSLDSQIDEIYTPFFWRYIMFLIKIVPSPIFKKFKL